MLRGWLAVVVLAILGMALLIDTVSGKATSDDYEAFGAILLVSAFVTAVLVVFSRLGRAPSSSIRPSATSLHESKLGIKAEPPASDESRTAPKLKKCPDCGGTVSLRALHCPHCGCPASEIP
jgi:hypothetical protein